MVKSKSMEVMKAVQEDLGEVRIRVFHKNMFEKKIIATHHASAWGLVRRDPKGFLISTTFGGSWGHNKV